MKRDIRKLCAELVEDWNGGDIERILSHYSEECVLVSPLVRDKLGIASGSLCGRENLRIWWSSGLEKPEPYRMEFVDVMDGVDSFLMIQRLTSMEKTGASRFVLNEDGLIEKEEFFY